MDCDVKQNPPATPELSVIVPCYNEQIGLAKLHQRLIAVLDDLGLTYEIVLIDDGSNDGTADAIRQLAVGDPHVRGLRFSRNFGHQAAVSAGYDHARGQAVIVMDADLQHPPELIPTFIEQWRQGYDVVYAYRDRRPVRWGYRLYNRLCNIRIPAEAADFRLMDRTVVDALKRMPERHRFVRGLVAWLGFRDVGVPYDEAPRHAGEPAYTRQKRFDLRIDSLFSFSTVPLRLSMILGAITLCLGAAYALWILGVLIFVGREGVATGWPALIMTVLILGGVQLLCLGMVAEYVGRTYEEVKQRPLYVVREAIEPSFADPATVTARQATASPKPKSPAS